MKIALQDYSVQQDTEEKARYKMTILAKQIGLNVTELTNDEIDVLIKALSKSDKYRQNRRQAKRRR